MSVWQSTPTGLRLTIWAQPGAKKTAVAGQHGEALKIQLHARPVEGAANEALIAFLAQSFLVPKRDVCVLRGEQQRHKLVEITGDPEALRARLALVFGLVVE